MFSDVFINAEEAFEELYKEINDRPVHLNGTKKILNVGIKILQPDDNKINTAFRNWSKSYAEREWAWYLSGDRSVSKLKQYAPIWDKMHNGDNIVNSNYGYQWNRNGQLDNVIEILRSNPLSRQAFITIHDGKEHSEHEYDTPCTLSIGFIIEEGLLCMNVLMRSNDLWYGFCNDQYCFSKLMIHIAKELKLDLGWYYHYATDMHLYSKHFDKS